MRKTYSHLEAVSLALAGYTLWVLADVSLKIAGASRLPAYEVLGGVGVSMVVLLLAHGFLRRDIRGLLPVRVAPQLVRSCLDLANCLGVVIALRHMPLALFYILIFFSPMVTTLLSAAFLGEALEGRKVVAIVGGFLGVVLAVNPLAPGARSGDLTGYLACLVCVLSFSANMVWSRRMTQTESTRSLTFTSASLMAVFGGAAMLRHAEPVNPKLLLVLAATGLFCVFGNACFFAALRHASAATVSQYHYSQLLTGALFGFFFWHERLSVWMFAGALLIVAAGAYTATRKQPFPVPSGTMLSGD